MLKCDYKKKYLKNINLFAYKLLHMWMKLFAYIFETPCTVFVIISIVRIELKVYYFISSHT